jgi:hypothetical protein
MLSVDTKTKCFKCDEQRNKCSEAGFNAERNEWFVCATAKVSVHSGAPNRDLSVRSGARTANECSSGARTANECSSGARTAK